jgi:hypothetical protein
MAWDFTKSAQRAAARAIDAMPHPRWGIGAQKLDTIESHPARLRVDAQQPDMIAAIPLGSFSMLQRRSNTEDNLRSPIACAGFVRFILLLGR